MKKMKQEDQNLEVKFEKNSEKIEKKLNIKIE